MPRRAATTPLDLDLPIAFIEKRRTGNDANAEALTLIGDVKDRDVIIVDDEVDTGGSIAQAIERCQKYGAREVYLAFIHPIFSRNAAQRLAELPIHHIITTDTVSIPEEKMKPLEGTHHRPVHCAHDRRSDPPRP